MSIYLLKPKFQALLRPSVNQLAAKNINANQVTIAACVLSVLIGLLLVACLSQSLYWGLLLLPFFLLLRMALNAIDGMLAREHQQQSPLGGYLNELTDVISDTALYLPLLLLPHVWAGWVYLLVFQAALTEFVGVLGQVHGNSRRYDGPMGKSDRAFWIGLCAVLWLVFPGLFQYNNSIFIVLNLLLTYTVYHRIINGLR